MKTQRLWHEASAATYISSDDPIYFIVHGTNDTVVPIAVSESFNAKLQAAGVETHFIKVAGGDHDILTSENENLVVRYSLEPLLKRVFNLDEQLVPEFPAPDPFSANAHIHFNWLYPFCSKIQKEPLITRIYALRFSCFYLPPLPNLN